jgi:DnaJ-class molecular chaperone
VLFFDLAGRHGSLIDTKSTGGAGEVKQPAAWLSPAARRRQGRGQSRGADMQAPKKKQKCKNCEGKGLLKVGDKKVKCQRCGGTGFKPGSAAAPGR